MTEVSPLTEVASQPTDTPGYTPTIEDLALSWYAANRSDGDEEALRSRYRAMRSEFEQRHGRIQQEWWSREAPGGVVLAARTVRTSAFAGRRWAMSLHRYTSGVTRDFPEIEQPLSAGDNLAMRANEILRGSPKRVALARLFGLASAFLGAIDATNWQRHSGLDTSAKEADERVERAKQEYGRGLSEAEGYYHKTAARTAQIDYFVGVGRGFVAVCLSVSVAVFIADILLRWSGISVSAETYASLIAAIVAGTLGSCVSVMWRISTGDFVSDYEAGREHMKMLGMFRPPIGAIFGLALYFAVQADLLSFANDDPNFYLLTFVAFVAGFSERFAPDVFGQLEGSKTAHE